MFALFQNLMAQPQAWLLILVSAWASSLHHEQNLRWALTSNACLLFSDHMGSSARKGKNTWSLLKLVRVRADGKIRTDSKLKNRTKIIRATPSLTTCDESGIICAYFLILFTVYVVIFVRFSVQMSHKSSCT